MIGKPIVIAPGAGEIIGDAPDRRVEILGDSDELAATWSRFGPGRDGAGLHIHREHADLFYVLEGELTVKRGEGDEVAVPTGTLVYIPPLVVHGFRNAGDVDVKYLNLHAPGCGFADYMRGIRDRGDTEWFDQLDPEGIDGLLPASEIEISSGDGTLCEAPAISVAVTAVEAGASPVTREPSPRGTEGVESIYVLEGDVAFELDDREGLAAPGTWIQTPLYTPSELSFQEGAARFVTIHTPSAG